MVLLIVAIFSLSRLFRSDPLADAVLVELEEAVTTSMQTRIVGSCTFRARRSVEVTSDVGGRAIAIPVRVGDLVTTGQTLVRFEQTEFRNAMTQTQTSLRETELAIAHRLAKLRSTIVSANRAWNDRVHSLERNRTLHRSGTVSEDQLSQAERAELDTFDTLQNARADLNLAASLPVNAEPPLDASGDVHIISNDHTVIQARLAAERAAENLRQTTVVAPLDGTVTRLEATLGNHLGAGHTVATVETLDDILAGVQIDEVDIGKIRLGQEVTLTTETLRDMELLGTITLIPPSMEAAGNVPLVTIDVDVDEGSLPDGARLLAGSSCRARIKAELKQDATAVPYAALLERSGETIVFVATPVEEEDVAYVLERREVELGVSTPNQVEVKEGIKPGDLVVVGNLVLLRDGLSVMAKREPRKEQEAADSSTPDKTPAQDQPAGEASTERS